MLPDNYYTKIRHFDKKIDTVIVSDSHGTSLDDDILKNVGIKNLSFASDSYLDMYRKLSYLLRQNDIEAVIISADRHTLSPYRNRLNNSSLSEGIPLRSGYMGSLLHFIPFFDVRAQRSFNHYLVTHLHLFIRNLFLNNNEDEKEQIDSWSEDIEERVEEQFSYSDPSQSMKEYLLDIIQLCNDKDIELLGIRYPLSKDFLLSLNGKDYGAKEILNDHGIKVLDYEEVFLDKKTMFKDPDHVTRDGGSVLSKIIVQSIGE